MRPRPVASPKGVVSVNGHSEPSAGASSTTRARAVELTSSVTAGRRGPSSLKRSADRQAEAVADGRALPAEQAGQLHLDRQVDALVFMAVVGVEPRHGVMQTEVVQRVLLNVGQFPERHAAAEAARPAGRLRRVRDQIPHRFHRPWHLDGPAGAGDPQAQRGALRQPLVGDEADALVVQVHRDADAAVRPVRVGRGILVGDRQVDDVPGGVAPVVRPQGAAHDEVRQEHVEAGPERGQDRLERVVGNPLPRRAPGPDQGQDADADQNQSEVGQTARCSWPAGRASSSR